MDFNKITNILDNQIFNSLKDNIYSQIKFEYIIYAMKAGIISGLVMAIAVIILQKTHVSKLKIDSYTGCMLTGESKSNKSKFFSFLFHIIMAAIFGVIDLFIIHYFKITNTITNIITLGVLNSIISGSCEFLLDFVNPCVHNKKTPNLGFMATAQGLNAMMSYLGLHIIYASIFIYLLIR